MHWAATTVLAQVVLASHTSSSGNRFASLGLQVLQNICVLFTRFKV